MQSIVANRLDIDRVASYKEIYSRAVVMKKTGKSKHGQYILKEANENTFMTENGIINNIFEYHGVFMSARTITQRLIEFTSKRPAKNLYCPKKQTIKITICVEASFLDTESLKKLFLGRIKV